jgi:hypothetical protein
MASRFASYTPSEDSFNWSISHILKFGDTDIFPVPFEYSIFHNQWNDVLSFLKSLDLANIELEASNFMMIPKHYQGFRAATQLDPIDCLLYTAMVYEMSSHIENSRIPIDQKISCSYRIDPKPTGDFFIKDSGWNDFHDKSEEYIENECEYVLIADISDFYNQVSHHRIQNALSSFGISENTSKVAERLLSNINSVHHSRGVPVGPSASILLTEACLDDVDDFLIRKGLRHTRYVDDFRIFCKDYEEALTSLELLSGYLYTSHRLSLQSSKTKILKKETFKAKDLFNPELEENNKRTEKILELFYSKSTSYEFTHTELGETDEDVDDEEILIEILQDILEKDFINLGYTRYLLRKATQLQSDVLVQGLIDNIEKFIPVFRDLILYFIKVHSPTNNEIIAEKLEYIYNTSPYKNIPFLQYWILTAYATEKNLCDGEKAMRMAEKSDVIISERMQALIAKTHGITDWVRSKKEIWKNYSPWAQRAIIWSSTALSSDERKHWLRSLKNYPNHSIKFIAQYLLSNS